MNNTTDGSDAVLTALAERYAGRLIMRIQNVRFPAELAHAGSARRAAMDMGCEFLADRPGAVLLSTDADCRPPRAWIAANLAAIQRGADLVGGRLDLDCDESIAPALERVRRMWDVYWRVVRSIEDTLDPVAWDPPPRHGDHTGGSLAITVEAYRTAGGVPLLPVGEDRGLVNAALAAGYRLSHPVDVWTRVSPRLRGRASSGMATELQSMASRLALGEAIRAPGWDHWKQRAKWRRQVRTATGVALLIAEEARLPTMPCDAILSRLVRDHL